MLYINIFKFNTINNNSMKHLLKLDKLKWVCHHLHLDKSNTINNNLLNESLVHMKEKWILMRDIKKKLY